MNCANSKCSFLCTLISISFLPSILVFKTLPNSLDQLFWNTIPFTMNYKGFLAVLGGTLIHLTLGAVYTSSNIITYVISYLHVVKEQTVLLSILYNFRISILQFQRGCFLCKRSVKYSLFVWITSIGMFDGCRWIPPENNWSQIYMSNRMFTYFHICSQCLLDCE